MNPNSLFQEWANYRAPCFYGLTEWTHCCAVITKGHSKQTYRAKKRNCSLEYISESESNRIYCSKNCHSVLLTNGQIIILQL